NVTVLGYGVAKALFPEGDAIGRTIKIGGRTFEIP
ncbi:MAG: hypothetical protein RL734_1991, partial [Bacteroidota bacterium]